MHLNLASVLKDEWVFKPGTTPTAGISSGLSLVELGHTGERPGTEETLASSHEASERTGEAGEDCLWLSRKSTGVQ